MADKIALTENNSIEDSLALLRYFQRLSPDKYPGIMFRNLLTALIIITKKLRSDDCTEAAKALFEWLEAYNKLQRLISPNNNTLVKQFIKSVPAVLTFVLGCFKQKPPNMPNFHFKLLTLLYTFLDNIDITLFGNEINLSKGVISCVWHPIQNGENFNTQLLALRVLTTLLKIVNKKCAEEELAEMNSRQSYPLKDYIKKAMEYTKPHPSAFDSVARNLLNHMNMRTMQNTSVYSVKCNSLFIEDKIEFFKPSCSEHFWVDLNSCPLTLTFTGRCRSKQNYEFVDISVIASINKIDLTNTKLTVFLRPPIIYSKCLQYLQDVYNATYATLEISKNDMFHLKQREELLKKFNIQYSDPVCYLNETVHEYNDIMNSFCDEEKIQNISPQNVEDCQFNNNMQDNERVLSSTPLSTIRSVDMIQSLNEFSQVSPISNDISVLNPNTRKRQLFTESNTSLTKRISPKKRYLGTENYENQRPPRLKVQSHNKETYPPSPKTKTQKPLISKMPKQIETFPALKTSKNKPFVPALQDANKPPLKNLTHKDFKKFTEPQWNEFINEITEDNCPELYKFLYGNDNDIFSIEQKTNLMKMMLQIPDDDLESPNENVNILQDKCKIHVICAKYSSCKFKTILQRSYTSMIQYEQTQTVEIDDNIPSTSGVNTGSSKNNVKKVARRKIDQEKSNLENNKKSKGKQSKMKNDKYNKLQNTDPSEKINNKTKPKRRRYEPKRKINKETLKTDKFFNKFFKTKVTNISDEIDPGIENSIAYFIHSNSFSANETENTMQEQQFAMSTNLNSLKKTRTPDELRNHSKIFNDNHRNQNIFDYSETYSKNEDSPPMSIISPNKITAVPYNELYTHIPDPTCKDVTYNNKNFENVKSPLTLYEPLYIETNFNENVEFRKPLNVNKHKVKELSITNNDKEIPSHPLYNECEIDQNIYNILLQENSVLQILSPSSIKKNMHHVDQDIFIFPKSTTYNEIVEKPKLISDPENTGLLMCSITSTNNSRNNQSLELLRENTRQESTNLMKAYKGEINLEAKELNDQLTENFFDETKKEICAVIREVLEKTKQKDKIENELLEAIYNVHRLYEKYQDVSDNVRRSEEKANNILQNIHFNNKKITTSKYFERLLNEFDVKSMELRKSKWKSYVKHNIITLIDGMDYISALNI